MFHSNYINGIKEVVRTKLKNENKKKLKSHNSDKIIELEDADEMPT
jgi:hypothetical protein